MFDPMEFEIDEPEKVVYVVGIGPGDVYYLTQDCLLYTSPSPRDA